MSSLEQFLSALSIELPEICSDRDLANHLPDIFKNHCTLNRMRARDQTPPYLCIEPNFYYLKDDVIAWLRSRYNAKNEAMVRESHAACAR